MAAPYGSRSSAENSGTFQGFPFNVSGRPTDDTSGTTQEKTGEPKKKPCRACTDFKSWMKTQKMQSPTAQVNVVHSSFH